MATYIEPEGVTVTKTLLPANPKERKNIPITTGVLDYFPAALAEVAKVSFQGNQQHNPGEELHWARNKSTDFADTIARHLLERGTIDSDGMRHSAKLAWRALALLQMELEAEGAPMARGARYDNGSADSADRTTSNSVYSNSGQTATYGCPTGKGSTDTLPKDKE